MRCGARKASRHSPLISVTGTRCSGSPRRCVSITTSASKEKPSIVARAKISNAARRLKSFSPHWVSVTSCETKQRATWRNTMVASWRETRRGRQVDRVR